MAICPHCHTDVGSATVCRGCGAYKTGKSTPGFILFLMTIFTFIISMIIATTFRSVIGFFIVFIPLTVILERLLDKHYNKTKLWRRKI